MEARVERQRLPVRERVAIDAAEEKLQELGDQLPFPHSSHVAGPIRELRLRAGRSRTRLLYSRVGETMWVLSIGPEAIHDERGFRKAVEAARARLEDCR